MWVPVLSGCLQSSVQMYYLLLKCLVWSLLELRLLISHPGVEKVLCEAEKQNAIASRRQHNNEKLGLQGLYSSIKSKFKDTF